MSWFTDVVENCEEYRSESRVADMSLLEPRFAHKVERIIQECAEQGHTVGVYETYRSQARQERLFQAGYSRLQHVGVHHFGLAVDVVFVVDGEPVWKGPWSVIGHAAANHDVVWGGDWGHPERSHPFYDAGHLQLVAVEDEGRLFSRDWYPGPDYSASNVIHGVESH